MHKKKKTFWSIWAKAGIPLMSLTGIVLVLLLNLQLSLFLRIEESRAREIIWEAQKAIEESAQDMGSNNLKLQLQIIETFGIASAVYNKNGEIIEKSDIIHNNHMQSINVDINTDGKSNARYMNNELSLFEISYIYGQLPLTMNSGEYTLRYEYAFSPWLEHQNDWLMIGFCIFAFMALFSLLIGANYYKFYKEQLKLENYYRETANALAHDLKTPLMAISGYAENLAENIHTEKKSYYAAAILKNINNMNLSIEQVLELARIEHSKIALEKKMVDMRLLTEEVLEQFQFTIEEKGLKAKLTGNLQINANSRLIKRVIENLVSNAVKYTPVEHEILICMEGNKYQVINTGVIIDEIKLKEVWKPFVKGEASRENVTGTGIGLAIVKDILDMHSAKYKISNAENGVKISITFTKYR